MPPRKAKKDAPRKAPFSFYGEDEFKYDMEMAKEYFEAENSHTVRLYRIDSVKTQKNFYGEAEAEEKVFLPPVTLAATLSIGNTKSGYMAKGGIDKQEHESFEVNLFMSELEEKNVNVRKGDFFAYHDGEAERFYEVGSATRINTTKSAFGFKPFYLTLSGILVGGEAIKQVLKNWK